MRHCNSIFKAEDIWYLLDKENETKRRLYLAKCPICNKEIALYCCILDNKEYYEKYYYKGGAIKIQQRLKKDKTASLLGFKTKYKMPSGFIYGKNKEIRRKGKIVEIKQYACDFFGNEILVKKIENE